MKCHLFFQTQTMPKVSHKVNRRYYFIIFFESTLRSPMLVLFPSHSCRSCKRGKLRRASRPPHPASKTRLATQSSFSMTLAAPSLCKRSKEKRLGSSAMLACEATRAYQACWPSSHSRLAALEMIRSAVGVPPEPLIIPMRAGSLSRK